MTEPAAVTHRDAYLARLGLDAEPPSAEALLRLHRAHVERVPYETLWIHTGARWDIDVDRSVERVATQRRGGYCFHLNGAFGELLRSLGYQVTRHVGGVHGPDGPRGEAMSNHLVLTVAALPSDANPEGEWYVDAGLGDALHEPVALRPGPIEQGPFRLALERSDDGIGDWHLSHDVNGSFTGMSWRAEPAAPGAFDAMHHHLSTSPESGFVKVLSAQRRDATGVDILRGLTVKRVGAGASETTIEREPDLAACLGDLFGLPVGPMVADGSFGLLWQRTHAAHVQWEAAGRA